MIYIQLKGPLYVDIVDQEQPDIDASQKKLVKNLVGVENIGSRSKTLEKFFLTRSPRLLEKVAPFAMF